MGVPNNDFHQERTAEKAERPTVKKSSGPDGAKKRRKIISPCHCNLRQFKRMDKFTIGRTEPEKYPIGLQTEFKDKYVPLPHERPGSVDYSNLREYYRNPLVGQLKNKPPLDGKTNHGVEYTRKPIEVGSVDKWARNNRDKDQVDHLNPQNRPKDWRPSTEYRDFSDLRDREVIAPAGYAKLNYGPKPKLDGKTIYNKDYTPKAGQKGYFDPKKAYEDNLNVVRSYFSTNNVGVGPGNHGPRVNVTTTAQDSYQHKHLPVEAELDPLGNRPSLANNWRIPNGRLEGKTIFQTDYINQGVTICPCPDAYSVTASSATSASQLTQGRYERVVRY